ncbi:hypothetical protein B0T25DRAFT_320311 [Lasiosphaeria hispida]|uniref:Uncharacterized protein n=1 Tax=Lasiosphaeria hispida TaxID=260671 RepID=A0AAJ0M9U3_9PEZI|nr:hypothetical protein B0T25DRAFT_320311 [Lasiosphaeria hispida]
MPTTSGDQHLTRATPSKGGGNGCRVSSSAAVGVGSIVIGPITALLRLTRSTQNPRKPLGFSLGLPSACEIEQVNQTGPGGRMACGHVPQRIDISLQPAHPAISLAQRERISMISSQRSGSPSSSSVSRLASRLPVSQPSHSPPAPTSPGHGVNLFMGDFWPLLLIPQLRNNTTYPNCCWWRAPRLPVLQLSLIRLLAVS